MPKPPDFDRGILLESLHNLPINLIAHSSLSKAYDAMREILICSLCESDAFQRDELLGLFLTKYMEAVMQQMRIFPTSPTASVIRHCQEVFARASLYHITGAERTERYYKTMRLLAK